MRKAQTCCFTGHRKLPKEQMGNIVKNLDYGIENLICQGVTDFISGGASGFDLIAISLMIAKKEMGRELRLILALPCKNQYVFWNEKQKRLHQELLEQVDEIVYVSEEYQDGCIERRNRYMVDRSAYCLCALLRPRSGIDQMVRYARQKGLQVVNVAD